MFCQILTNGTQWKWLSFKRMLKRISNIRLENADYMTEDEVACFIATANKWLLSKDVSTQKRNIQCAH